MDGRDPSRSEALRGHIATARSPSDGSDLHLTLAMRGLLWNVRSPSSRDLHRTAESKTRSRRDRGHDQPRSRLLQRRIKQSILPTESDGDRWSINITIDARSCPDRVAIVARSWLPLKWNQGEFTANSGATTLTRR